MLLLTVVSPQASALGDRARHLFGPAGGVIGRGGGCDWVLPDERRHLSGRHARIAHNGLGFLITDTSTNGVFLNQRTTPLGRDRSAPLGHGDRLHLADYVIEAVITDQPAVTPSLAAPDLAMPASTVPDLATSGLPRAEPSAPPLAFSREVVALRPGGAIAGGGSDRPEAFWAALGIPASHVSPEAQDRLWHILGTALREAGAVLAGGQTVAAPAKTLAEPLPEPAEREADGGIDRSIRSFVQREIAGARTPAQVASVRSSL